LLDDVLCCNGSVGKCGPESTIKALYVFNARFNALVSMQNNVIGIKVKVFLAAIRIGEMLKCLFDNFSIGHRPSA